MKVYILGAFSIADTAILVTFDVGYLVSTNKTFKMKAPGECFGAFLWFYNNKYVFWLYSQAGFCKGLYPLS